MTDRRERKKNKIIKSKGGAHLKKDARRSMTLKLKKELAQQTRSRGDGGSAEVQPEAQAAQQIEDSAVILTGGVGERVTDGVSKAVRRGRQNKTEQRQARQRPEAPTGETPPPTERTPQPTQQPRDRMRRRAVDDLRTHRTEAGQTPPTPRERPAPEIAHEKPRTSTSVKQSDTETPLPKEWMRQTAIKDRRTQGTELRQKPDTPMGRTLTAPKERQDPKNLRRNESEKPTAPAMQSGTAAPPKERKRQTIIKDGQTRETEDYQMTDAPREQTSPAPKERPSPEIAHEKPGTSAPAMQSNTAAPPPKERIRETAIKDRRTQKTEIRQKPETSREWTPAKPIHERTPESVQASTAPPFTPQERMKQRAVTELKEKRIEEARELAAPPSTHIPESNGISHSHQSINPSIRERPRRTAALKEKPAGGAFQPKTREAAQTAGKPTTRTGPAPLHTPQAPPAATKRPTKKAPAATKAAECQLILERGRKQAQRDAQRHVLQTTQKAAKAAAETGEKVAVATVKAVKGLITALAGLLGGGTLIAILCILGLIAAIIASPFGILFSNAPSPGAIPLNTAVARIRMELNSTLDALQEGDYDGIDIEGQPPDWREVVAVFAVKTSGTKDGVDVAALTPDRVSRLQAVFWDMCAVTSEVETVEYPDRDPDDDADDSYTEVFLHITITAKTAEEMRAQYAFTAKQNEALDELLIELSAMTELLEDLAVSEEQARALVRNLPADLSPERRAVVEAACQLVGKVTYFWGGKSLVLGWDDRWGTLQKVWAEGHRTTGTYQAYGLDCSGFVDWAFYNASNGAYYPGHGGGTYMQHSHCTPVSMAEAQPGDLVFTSDIGHVGIVGSRDEAGNLLIVHCFNSVGITGIGEFTIVGRPDYFTE